MVGSQVPRHHSRCTGAPVFSSSGALEAAGLVEPPLASGVGKPLGAALVGEV